MRISYQKGVVVLTVVLIFVVIFTQKERFIAGNRSNINDNVIIEKQRKQFEKEKKQFEKEREEISHQKKEFENQKKAFEEQKLNFEEQKKENKELAKEIEQFENDKETFAKEKEGFSKEKEGLSKEKEGLSKEKEGFSKEKENFAKEKERFLKEKEDFEKEKDEFEKKKQKFEEKKKQFLEENDAFEDPEEEEEEEEEEENEKIDVVFTWAGIIKTMNNRNRYNYELQFSLRAVHKYLPWVNKIYVLINSDTDYPYWINKEKSGKVVVYDRCKIIEKPEHCPTLNTFAVFSALEKIEGLSNKFILIDDDVFINQPLTPDFFFKDDFPRVLQRYNKMKIYKDNREFKNIKRPEYKFAMYSHLPKPMRKDLIVKFHEEYPEYAKLVQSHHTGRYKKLSEEFSMIYYQYFYDNKWMKPESRNKSDFYQIPHTHPADITREFDKIYKDLISRNIKTFNCNDDYSTNEELYPKQRKVLWDFYMKLYPEVPDYEIPNPDHAKYS
ncbi:hypothetical protein M0812_08259 [Anaeramoeba flamelloides]|uniref:Stealth protein CR2 conserved region 2 domain-containing protein n=1 Tax=Anaeramoeba flamelloides TaxID=1746091 RepID=A0AAV7ZYP1_9EUKA|nr:hypothetical protein M0812_08259 [Anaeramoeba flamelloides]